LFFTILFTVLAWKRLDLATAFLIAVLPVYQIRFQIGFLPMTLLEAMILVLFAAWFVKSWRANELPLLLSFPRKRESKKNVQRYPFWLEIILLLVIAFISAATAGFNSSALGILKAYFIEPAMFFIVFVNIFSARIATRSSGSAPAHSAMSGKIPKNREKIFWALAISALFVSAIAIYQRITGNLMPATWQNTGRVTGVFAYPNAVGLYLGPIMLILIGRLFAALRNIKYLILNIFFSITIILSLLAIYFAKSEGALAGVAAALFIFGLLYNKKSRWVIAGLAVLAAGGIAINSQARDYAINKIMLRDLDGQIRRQIWVETWEMLASNPKNFIFGAGLANYQSAVAPYHQDGIFVRDYNDLDWHRKTVFNAEYRAKVWQPVEIYLYPHSLFFNFWVELGLAGVLLFIWIIGKFFVIGYKLYVKNEDYSSIILGLIGAMIVIIVHGLVDVPYFKNDLAVLFWILVGIIGVYRIEFFPQINESSTNNTNKK